MNTEGPEGAEHVYVNRRGSVKFSMFKQDPNVAIERLRNSAVLPMWKIILAIAGAVVACVTVGAMVQFCPLLVYLLAGLVGGSFGLLLGMMADARRIYWKPVLGILGLMLGAPAGGVLVWMIAAPFDSFSGGGLAGLFLGTPIGAIVGALLGVVLGARVSKYYSS